MKWPLSWVDRLYKVTVRPGSTVEMFAPVSLITAVLLFRLTNASLVSIAYRLLVATHSGISSSMLESHFMCGNMYYLQITN